MTQDDQSSRSMDPFSAWTGARDAYLDQWSKIMIDFVHSDAYSEASGKALDRYLTASAPFRVALEKAMSNVLTQLNMPTRSDITTLAERLTNIEMRLDDMDAKIDGLQPPAKRSPSGGSKK